MLSLKPLRIARQYRWSRTQQNMRNASTPGWHASLAGHRFCRFEGGDCLAARLALLAQGWLSGLARRAMVHVYLETEAAGSTSAGSATEPRLALRYV